MSIIQIFSITWQVGSPSVIKYQNIKSNNKYWAINSLELFTNWKLDWLGVRSTVSSPDQLMFCKVGSWILNMLKSFIFFYSAGKKEEVLMMSLFSPWIKLRIISQLIENTSESLVPEYPNEVIPCYDLVVSSAAAVRGSSGLIWIIWLMEQSKLSENLNSLLLHD